MPESYEEFIHDKGRIKARILLLFSRLQIATWFYSYIHDAPVDPYYFYGSIFENFSKNFEQREKKHEYIRCKL